jgi:hypothetical protein
MNRNDIENAIEPQVSTGMIIISASFLMGVLFMYAIGYYVHLTAEVPPADAFNDGHFSRILAQVTLIYFAASIFAGRFLFRKLLKTDQATDPYLVVNNIRTAMLVQLALIEGAALLGAVSFLMGALDGYTQVNTVMWGTFLPLVYMAYHITIINPPASYIMKTYDTYFRS